MADRVNPPLFSENGERHTGGFFPGIFTAGFDPKFKCRQCHRILRDPVQSPCGHRFCRSCLDEILSANREVNCSACEEEQVEDHEMGILSMASMFPDNAVKREMSTMATSCIFPGCNWRGRFKEYEAHERNCEFKQVACALCAQAVTGGRIEDHRVNDCSERVVTCEFCNTETVFSRLKSHQEQCEKFPVECERCGQVDIIRESMRDHVTHHCPKRSITCPMGCTEQFQYDKFPEHLRKLMEPHLAWTMQKLVTLEQKLEEALGTVGTMPPSGFSQIKEDINRIERKLFVMTLFIMGDHFADYLPLSKEGPEMQGFERHIQQLLQSRPPMTESPETQRSEGAVSAELAAKASLKLVEPIIGVLHHELDRAVHSLQSLEGHYRQQQAQLDEIENQCRMQQQQLQLKDAALADLEMRLSAQELARYDGTILWKVSGFEAKKREAISGQTTSLYSPAFYSGPCGYKMCARIYPNGDGIGKGSHISLFFVIMRGHYDALLPWPFSQKVTLMMIDQNHKEHIVDAFKPDPSSSSFKRPTTEMNIASGCPLFLPLDKLHSRQYGYLRDDTIFVKIIVDTDGLERFTEMNPGRFTPGYP